MRRIIYVGDRSCRPCRHYKETVIGPLMRKHPGAIEVHTGWDAKIAEINGRSEITRVPTLVVENDGAEEFRFSAFLEPEQLEGIIMCRDEVTSTSDICGL